MITAARQALTPARWVTADEAYGNNSMLRARLRALRLGYVLAISRDHLVPISGGKARRRADHLAAGLPAWAWTRRSAGHGSKGPRLYDWAWLTDVGTDADPGAGGQHSLLIRRNYTTGELAFYRCWTPEPAGLAQLVHIAGTRWTVEEGFQTAKGQVGLDQHQVRQWQSWHRHATLALAALAILAICAANERPEPNTIRRSANEIRRLINILIQHPAHDTAHRLHWSNWRTQHRQRATRAHYTRRLTLEFQP
jgi:SRSO17 transposase